MTITPINETRRTLIKSGLAASAAMTIGIPVTSAQAQAAKKIDCLLYTSDAADEYITV